MLLIWDGRKRQKGKYRNRLAVDEGVDSSSYSHLSAKELSSVLALLVDRQKKHEIKFF
jgi:hypothetical protein